MRPEVQAFVAEGALPGGQADAAEIDSRVAQLEAIAPPVTAEEAAALATCSDRTTATAWPGLCCI